MKFAKSVFANSCRRGKPFGRHSFNNGPKGMANGTPEKPVVLRGSGAPGIALFFGFNGYLIWQMVELRRITKAAEKGIEYHRQARLWSTRVSEGYDEIFRLISTEDEAKVETESKPEAKTEPEAIPEAKHWWCGNMEMPWWCGNMEMPWWCGSA